MPPGGRAWLPGEAVSHPGSADAGLSVLIRSSHQGKRASLVRARDVLIGNLMEDCMAAFPYPTPVIHKRSKKRKRAGMPEKSKIFQAFRHASSFCSFYVLPGWGKEMRPYNPPSNCR